MSALDDLQSHLRQGDKLMALKAAALLCRASAGLGD